VTMKNAIFWAVTPCGAETARRFGGTNVLHLQKSKLNLRSCLASPSTLKTDAICRALSELHDVSFNLNMIMYCHVHE
jgi:hypothetical protein